ncbi:MAG TPA: S8 family serine peptidase, partial [Chloroflexota bacterium]|nr:S8 family serine peptidase [Chloroflexota bacterium]
FEARVPDTVAASRRSLNLKHSDLKRFLMPDHGLFAAGLIRDIVPDAEVHILRVLNDYGVGDLLGLSWVLGQLPKTFLLDAQGQPNGKRLVVNLSLMADVPPGVNVRSPSALGEQPPSNAFLRYWFPAASRSRTGAELRRHLQLPANRPVLEAIRDVHLGLQQLVSALSLPLAGAGGAGAPVAGDGDLRGQQLLVAAAGNDSLPGQTPPPPRLPARYDSVFGVAAVNRKLAAAKYSNLGDDVQLGNAVAVFGGDAAPGPNPDDPNLINTNVPEGTVDAVVGVFSAPTFPQLRPAGPGRERPPKENETGWAYWAGTSFATPIVSGLSASVWSAQPGLPPRKVLDAVRSFASAGTQLAAPVIEADQVR